MLPYVDPYLLLEQIARNRSELRLLNIFKGLPISHDVRINSIDNSEIQVLSNRNQLACLYHQRETYLQGAELPFILRSQVVSLHLGKESATLANLVVAPNGIGKRMQIRVEPDEPLLAVVKFDGSSVDFFALIADISAEGAGIYFENFMFPYRLCKPGNTISVTIPLPDTVSYKTKKLPTKPLRENRISSTSFQSDVSKGQDGKVVISTRGVVVSVHPEFRMGRYKVGMRLHFKDLARAAILQYIARRQTEIIRDLGALSDDLHNRKA